ncbi:MAG TPA: response regulator [Oxalicibacterium sp.]|nr:response regulator [Oxalicibacterium sp.]
MIKGIRQSILRKFTLAMLATTLSALLLCCTILLIYDVRNFESSWIGDLTTQSDILAKANLAALEFNDPKVVKENLDQLKARPSIIAAAIYAANGRIVASYGSTPAARNAIPTMPANSGYDITDGQIALFKPITRGSEMFGTVYLRAEYPLAHRIKNYALIMAAVMAASLFFAAIVASWLQRAIAKPILALTDAVNDVIRNRDFSVRVSKTADDETGVLVDAFNHMLNEVGHRAKDLEDSNLALQREMRERVNAQEALQQLNDTLEQRIAARTSELQRAHDDLRQAQKLEAIGQLTGGVAHDFNNVLQVISGNLQLLQMSLPADANAQTRLQSAAFAAERGAKLSMQLLAFARRQPLRPVATNLSRVLRGMDDLLRRALGESVLIETVVTGGLWTTLVDQNQIENVILNLAINARDAMNNGGKLTLELGNAMLDDDYVAAERDVPAGQYVMLAISDTGSGMPPEVAARAFEPFFTTKREGEGTGLGLSMAHGFVKQSQGHIKIYSEVGSGTTVRIYLPRCHQPEADSPQLLKGPAVGGSETILVVEDDPSVQATAVDMLIGLGYHVLKANDGESALAILESGAPVDLLFTDVVMPGPLRSPELAQRAKQLLPHLQVLFTSGYTQNAIVHGGRLDPGVELISKPYRRDDLARKIRHILANAAQANKAPGAPTDKLPSKSASMRILVVEDNEDAKIMLCDLLTALGYKASDAASAEEALEKFGTQEFDALLTDVMLPGMSGIELARRMLANRPSLKIIFSSGYGEVSQEEAGIRSASLPKPYDLEDLQKALDSL